MPGDSMSEVTSADTGDNDDSGLNGEAPTETESSVADDEPAESGGGSVDTKQETGEQSFSVSEIIQKFSGTIPTSVGAILTGTANAVVNIVSNGFLVLVFILFLILGATPDRKPKGIFAEIDEKVRRYIVIKIVSSAITGTLVAIILISMKLDLALAFGVLAFLLNFIPSIGSVISTMLPIPVAMVQYDSRWMVLWVLLLPGTVQMVVGNIIEPKVMGDGLDLHPITILVALIFWGLLWGIPGMFMAAPITAVIKIVSSRFETTRPAAELMAGRFPDFDEAPEQNTG
jgi:AI-2 transport protein TqsA